MINLRRLFNVATVEALQGSDALQNAGRDVLGSLRAARSACVVPYDLFERVGSTTEEHGEFSSLLSFYLGGVALLRYHHDRMHRRREPILFSSSQVSPVGDYFAVVNSDGNFEVGCQTFYPAIWNQYVLIMRISSRCSAMPKVFMLMLRNVSPQSLYASHCQTPADGRS